MIVIARSGTAIAAELGAMKINGEIAALERLGIDPERYLLLPRVIGAATSVMLLTIYFVLTSFVVLSDCLVWPPISYDQFIQGLLPHLEYEKWLS